MNYESFFHHALQTIRDQRRYRIFAELECCAGRFPEALHHASGAKRPVTVWCSNDYLGMSQVPRALSAMERALSRCGASAGGTQNISGTNHYHVLLEHELARLHEKQAALLFTSGYVANLTALSTLASKLPDCVVFSDEANHASMIEGIWHSRAAKVIFRHTDPEDLDREMREYPIGQAKIVAF